MQPCLVDSSRLEGPACMRSDDRELHLMMSGEWAARRQERDSSTPAAAL